MPPLISKSTASPSSMRTGAAQSGEFDLIARQGEILVFVEVRTRRERRRKPPSRAFPHANVAILERLAYLYLEEHQLNSDWRIDVIAVTIPYHGDPIIEHVEDALDW